MKRDRGAGSFSAYQGLSLGSIVYTSALAAFFGSGVGTGLAAPDLQSGLAILARPGLNLALQAIWLLLFLYTGVSMVTDSSISFHVREAKSSR